MTSWTLTLPCTCQQAQTASAADMDSINWQSQPVIVAQEAADERPDEWILTAYFEDRPVKADTALFADMIDAKPGAPRLSKLSNQDWVTVSQMGLEPIKAGRFHVHTPDFPASTDPAITSFSIPASLAFGTGHHETTYGCLMLLDAMRRSGVRVDNMFDLGTGTGLLAFAAHILWPRAYVISSDIDPVCADILAQNIASNGLRPGWRQGEIGYVTADGMEHMMLQDRAPYDLITANILAGPLAEMADDIASALVPGGQLILAGLLASQYNDVARAYRKQGLRVAHRLDRGDWSILWLRKRLTK